MGKSDLGLFDAFYIATHLPRLRHLHHESSRKCPQIPLEPKSGPYMQEHRKRELIRQYELFHDLGNRWYSLTHHHGKQYQKDSPIQWIRVLHPWSYGHRTTKKGHEKQKTNQGGGLSPVSYPYVKTKTTTQCSTRESELFKRAKGSVKTKRKTNVLENWISGNGVGVMMIPCYDNNHNDKRCVVSMCRHCQPVLRFLLETHHSVISGIRNMSVKETNRCVRIPLMYSPRW